MHRFNWKKYGKQQMILLLFLFLIGGLSEVWGLNYAVPGRWYSGNLAANGDYCLRIRDSGTYYFNNVTGGRIVADASNLNVTLCFGGSSNILTSYLDRGEWVHLSAIDLHQHDKYGNNTFTIKSIDPESPASVKCSGAGESMAIQPGILVYSGSKVIIDGPISVTATGGYYNNYKSPGIGGHCADGTYWHSGSLELRNGAYLYNDVVYWKELKQVAYTTISDYAAITSFDREQPLANGGGKSYWLDYDRIDVKPTVGWHDFKTSYGITGQIYYREKATNITYRLFFPLNRQIEWLEIDGCPGSFAYGAAKMGVVYDENGNYYKSLVSSTFPSGSTLYLNINNYTYTGTYNGKAATLSGNYKTFYSDKFYFNPYGGALKLFNMNIENQFRVNGSVYVDADNPGNLENWNVIDYWGRSVWYCKTLGLPESVLNFDVWTSDREDWNTYSSSIGDKNGFARYATGKDIYMWLPKEAGARYVNLKKNTDPNLVYKSGVITLSAHNTSINFSRYIAVKSFLSGMERKIYASLENAFEDVAQGETIKLWKNYTSYGSNCQTDKLSVKFDLNNYKLTSSTSDRLGGTGNSMLELVDNGGGGGGLAGVFQIQNLYTELLDDKLSKSLYMGGEKVFRTWTDKVPTGISGYLGYSWNGKDCYPARLNASRKGCLWLPAGTSSQTFTLYDGSAEGSELIATATLSVNENHANQANAYPYVDISKGNVTITPSNAEQTVKYGTRQKYTATARNTSTDRLPVFGQAVSDMGKDYALTVASGGTGTAYLSLCEMNIKPQTKAALRINGTADIELKGTNKLEGGYSGGVSFPAAQLTSASSALTWRTANDGYGKLTACGAAYGDKASPAISAESGASMTIAGGTIVSRRINDEGMAVADNSIEGGTQKIFAGSVDAGYTDGSRPTNKSGKTLYKVSVTTGLEPGQPYNCIYTDADPAPFWAMPDEAGKIYCWQPEQPLSDPKTVVTLTHPVSYEKKEVEVAKVEPHDRNVAPIVIEVTDLNTREVNSYGNLQDAFNEMQAGTPDVLSRYSLALLTRIDNLSTVQTIPANTEVTLNLQSFEIAAQNGSNIAFDASASGAYLNITGKGNIKNTFRIVGDVFIDGVVPLTDAVVMVGGEAVFRTLVKELPVGETNTYTYSYGQKQNVPFFLHNGLACLWLPDYGKSEELRFTVGGSGGSSTEYTAGGITTVTQRTEAIPASPVGVVARVTYGNGSINQAYNTLKEALESARKASVELHHADVALHLLTGVSVSGNQTMAGSFLVNLDGKNITSASGGQLTVVDGARIRFYDETVGMKGTMTVDVDLKGDGQLFVPSSIRLKGTVIRDGVKDVAYWRTMVNTRYAGDGLTGIIYAGVTYPVISDETCLWLPQNNDSKEEYVFTVGSENKVVTGYIVSANSHDNDMTIGGSSNAARIGVTEYATVEAAFAALSEEGQTIELLKTSSLETALSLTCRVTIELGKYGLTPSSLTPDTPPALTIGSGGQLTVTSKTGTGELKAPLALDGGLMYIGQGITGDHIGKVTDKTGGPLYRLLVTDLPATIPTGEHTYAFTAGDGTMISSGQFMVRNGVACLWFPETMAGTLTFTLGSKAYKTENITVNPDHFNLETYGVSDVAQIRNGKKYRKLAEALNDAAGKTVIVLKNAVLENAVSISGSITLETGDYSITSSADAQITVPESANLRITGNGSVSVGFTIISSAAGSIYSNGNLQVDRSVNMEATSKVYLDASPAYRVNVNGLPVTASVVYDCSDQSGRVKSSESGELCLWMQPVNQPVNFSAEAGTDTYLATGIIITPTHVNPLMVTYVEGIAAIGDNIYDTLAEALTLATGGETVVLRKDLTGLAGSLEARSNATISLDNNRLITATEGLTLDAGNHQLTLQDGTLEGAVAIEGNVYMKSSVIMNNARVSAGGKNVWRTFLKVPAGTASFGYTFGDITATCTNIKEDVACLWLPSSNTMQSLIVNTGNTEYALNNVIIASTHGNELDLTGGNDPVAAVGANQFASLASALATATEGGTVRLLKDVSLSSVQDIQKSLTLDLGGFSYTSGNSGFSVVAGKELTIARGSLLGTIRLNGEGSVKAGSDVKVAGIVLNKDNKECYRTLMKVGPDAVAVMQCHWLESAALTYDLLIPQGSDTYEATVPADLDNHNTELTAYKRVVLGAGSHSWQPAYANTNLVLAGDAELSFENVTGTTILHRLTIRDGALVKTSATAGMVIAEEGIRYVRSFVDANQWESVALPFTTTRITTEESGQTVLLTPATGTGTAGNFWLKTMSAEGKLQNVSTTEMTANVSYLMAVPTMWSAREITFVSGPNQLLRRDKVLAVKPASGFASYANGTFDRLEVKEACYLLNVSGDAFELEQPLPVAVTVEPFRGYLLADVNTTTVLPTLRIGTATDVVIPSLPENLRIYTRRGCVVVEAQEEEDVFIYRFDGSLVRALRVGVGQTEILLAGGFYIVNRTKVIVKY